MEGKFNEYAKLIDGTLLTGIQKARIWQHFAMAKFSWDFLISDVPPSFVEATLRNPIPQEISRLGCES